MVSSSGYLELVKFFFGDISVVEESFFMMVVFYVVMVLSMIVVFCKDIVEIIGGLFVFKDNEVICFSFKIIFLMVFVVLVGIMLEDIIESLFN